MGAQQPAAHIQSFFHLRAGGEAAADFISSETISQTVTFHEELLKLKQRSDSKRHD